MFFAPALRTRACAPARGVDHHAAPGRLPPGGEELLRRDVVDVDLGFSDEEKQEIERPLKGRKFDAVVSVGNHGAGMVGRGGRRAMEKWGDGMGPGH